MRISDWSSDVCSASTSVSLSSKVTVACLVAKLTCAPLTPSTLFNACLTVMGQDEHVMPGTKSVTVCEAAQTDELNPAARTIAVKIFFMTFPSGFNTTVAGHKGTQAQPEPAWPRPKRALCTRF